MRHQGAPTWWLVAHSFAFWSPHEASSVSYVQEKIVKKFHGIWTSFGIDFLLDLSRELAELAR